MQTGPRNRVADNYTIVHSVCAHVYGICMYNDMLS